MATADDFDEVLEQYHLALDEIVKGSADGYKRSYSQELRQGEVRRIFLPRTRVNKGCASSRRIRPFGGKQRGAFSDSADDGTTPNVASNHPQLKTQAGPDAQGTSAGSTMRYYDKAVPKIGKQCGS
jgi:hypothetical protein